MYHKPKTSYKNMSNSANVSRLLARFDVTVSIMQMLINNIHDDLNAIRSTHVEDDATSDTDTEIDTHSIAESINSITTVSYECINNKYTKKQCSVCDKHIPASNYSKHQKVHNKTLKNVHIVENYF